MIREFIKGDLSGDIDFITHYKIIELVHWKYDKISKIGAFADAPGDGLANVLRRHYKSVGS